ncbi:hypothetical protein NNC51_14660, partial [Prevotella copri]|nr:hypothetical protein [Segatella copri]MCP9580643.1 hypothetical protein [Segatella copri]MCP9589432.1 hypothetical protein [Segatella copri]MCP9592266.1 hypothetical protein [Segatella copri]MCP9595181.1 hypothetical protein [Segatella copri]
TMLMPTCSRQTLVKDHAFLVKPAYYLKSLYGVRGFCVCDISVVQEICTINLKSASNLNRNLNRSKELEHYAS